MGREAISDAADVGLYPVVNSSALILTDLIAEQAARYPDAVAIVADGRDHSYAELDHASRRIGATVSAALGDTRDVLVGVSAQRTFAMIATLIGVMRAGAAYLPLDPDLPAARNAQIVEDARPRLLLTDASGAFEADLPDVPVMTIADALTADPADCPDMRLADSGSSSRLAYVIYTSGSTGRPKGVEIEHASVVNLIESIAAEPGFASGDTMLAVARMGFDVSVLSFFLPLALGGRLALVDQATAADPKRLAKAITASGATVLNATPATWRALIATGWSGSPTLRAWCGGEALTHDLAAALLQRCRELWNCYGPTETTVWSTMQLIESGDDVSIGEPIAETGLCILDPALRAVRPGEIGELCISGAGLARGYRGRPALTAERFPTMDDGVRIYRTGDLVRRGPGGALLYAGRIDDQVKIRGHRVEMGEVEAILARHPAVGACAVRCWPDAIGENALCAYVVPRGQDLLPTEALYEHMRAALPAYMLPHRIVSLASMPLTANGKFDRNALPSPKDASPPIATTDLRGEIEHELAAIWQELLGVADVGVESDFFDLGGYSLMTVHLQCRIEERFGVDLALPDLLAASSLVGMADAIRNDASRGGWRPIPLRPHGSRPPLYWLDGGPLIRTVAREMRGDHPVTGVNLTIEEERRLDRPGVRVEEIAEIAARRVLAVSPVGPLYLAGWCRWGVVAYETARLLREEGRVVQELFLLDAECPTAARRWRERMANWVRTARGTERHPQPPSFGQRVDDAAARYVARRYDGSITLILPQDPASPPRDDGGWRRHVNRVRTVRSPGDHVTMVRRPHATNLAAALDLALSAA